MEIPPVVIDRLPLYARALASLETHGREVVSLAGARLPAERHAGADPEGFELLRALRQTGAGYNVQKLLDELRRILGLNRQWKMALVGTGRLGRAILGYEGFTPQGFRIVEAFDSDPSMIGKPLNDLMVKDTADLETVLTEIRVDVGIVAVPGETAQDVIDALVRCGVRAILNYAPIAARAARRADQAD